MRKDPDAPVELVRRLEACSIFAFDRAELIKRWHWVIEGYCELYLDRDTFISEKDAFVEEAKSIIANQDAIDAYRRIRERSTEPLTEREQQRRDEWRRSETERLERLEVRKQRTALKEGHQTLTLIRRHLRSPGQSRRQESRPEKTSPTS